MSQLCNKQFGSLCVFLDLFVYFFVKGIFKKKKQQHSNLFLAFMKHCPMFPGRKAKKLSKGRLISFQQCRNKKKTN